MNRRDSAVDSSKRLFGWMGAALLLGIIPVKLVRFEHHAAMSLAIGVAPSLLGPAGLEFLLLSSTGRMTRFSLGQITLLVAVLSVTLEVVQLLPRPGILAHVHYTYDSYDLAATLLSVVMAHAIAARILRPPRPAAGAERAKQ